MLTSHRRRDAAGRIRKLSRIGAAPIIQRAQHSRAISSEDDDDMRNEFDSDSEEEERRLSEQHGEAEEADRNTTNTSTGKRKQTDEEIADEYAKEASKTKKPRKPRIVLESDHLVKADGLIKIHSRFPNLMSKVKTYRVPASKPGDASNARRTKKRNAIINRNAMFASRLAKAYRQFCNEILPGGVPEDTLLRIEALGSRAQTKQHLKQMRNDVRNHHVVRLYGLERGEALLRDLQDGLDMEQGLGDLSASTFAADSERAREQSTVENRNVSDPISGSDSSAVSTTATTTAMASGPAQVGPLQSTEKDSTDSSSAATPSAPNVNADAGLSGGATSSESSISTTARPSADVRTVGLTNTTQHAAALADPTRPSSATGATATVATNSGADNNPNNTSNAAVHQGGNQSTAQDDHGMEFFEEDMELQMMEDYMDDIEDEM